MSPYLKDCCSVVALTHIRRASNSFQEVAFMLVIRNSYKTREIRSEGFHLAGGFVEFEGGSVINVDQYSGCRSADQIRR